MILNSHLKPTLFAKRLVAREHQSKKHKRVMVTGLMLTSMVDMFSLLVIFLLQNFSNSPEVMAISQNLVLPSAISAAAPIDAPLVTVNADEVLVDSKPMGSTKTIISKPQALIDSLEDMKKSFAKSHPGEPFKGDIHLQADQGLSSVFISQLVGILNTYGYSSVHLAVVNGGGR
ncbi:MAG: biopolymer transporter ExbD [Bdellovibrionales bacterium]